jgi:hypothetical protein
MKPFLRITTNINGSQPVFDTTGLDSKQQEFINGCLKTWQQPEFQNKPWNLAVVMWKSKKDFCGMLTEVEDPFIAQMEFESTWENAGMTL